LKSLTAGLLLTISFSRFAGLGQDYMKGRKLTDLEKKQLPLLKCVDKLAKKDKIDQAKDVLKMAMTPSGRLNSDLDIIKRAEKICKDYTKGRDVDAAYYLKAALDSGECSEFNSNTSSKVSSFIRALQRPSIERCSESHVDVTVAAMLQIKTGLASLKCVKSDGKVVRYIGPHIGWGIGMGASVQVKTLDDSTVNSKEGKIGAVSSLKKQYYSYSGEAEFYSTVVAGKTRMLDTDDGDYKDDNSFGVGAHVGMNYEAASAQIRTFNGKRQWSRLFDDLK
jgi:hypothetical protein